jgi:hypothetical protein
MTQLAQAFGANFNKDNVRIRSFEFGGHTFKVKVPLTSEYEALLDLANKVDDEKVDKYYAEITKEFVKNKDKITPDMGVVFEKDDVIWIKSKITRMQDELQKLEQDDVPMFESRSDNSSIKFCQ